MLWEDMTIRSTECWNQTLQSWSRINLNMPLLHQPSLLLESRIGKCGTSYVIWQDTALYWTPIHQKTEPSWESTKKHCYFCLYLNHYLNSQKQKSWRDQEHHYLPEKYKLRCSTSGEELNIIPRAMCPSMLLNEMTDYSRSMKTRHPH